MTTKMAAASGRGEEVEYQTVGMIIDSNPGSCRSVASRRRQTVYGRGNPGYISCDNNMSTVLNCHVNQGCEKSFKSATKKDVSGSTGYSSCVSVPVTVVSSGE